MNLKKILVETSQNGGCKMKKFLKDFKEFAMKGNVIDMAVGVVIGSAFGKIVSSFVADVVTPLLGLLLGKIKFTDLRWVIKAAGADPVAEPEVALTYGNFLQSVIDFLIISLAIFIVLRVIMNLKDRFAKKQEEVVEEIPAEPEQSEELKTLIEIRDLLKKDK